MPQTLPNGLVCPEEGDNIAQACQQIKDLFVAVDALQTLVGTEEQLDKITQTIPSGGWTLIGPVECKVYQQTLTVPTGVDTSELVLSILNSANSPTDLTITVTGPNTILIETNSPENYTAIYA